MYCCLCCPKHPSSKCAWLNPNLSYIGNVLHMISDVFEFTITTVNLYKSKWLFAIHAFYKLLSMLLVQTAMGSIVMVQNCNMRVNQKGFARV